MTYQVQSHGAKEALVLDGPDAQRSFSFTLTTSKGTKLLDRGDGAATVIDAAGEPLFDVGQTFAEDAGGEGTARARAESSGVRSLATQGLDLGRCIERVTGIEPAWPAPLSDPR